MADFSSCALTSGRNYIQMNPRERLLIFTASLALYLLILILHGYFFNTWRGEAVSIPILASGILFGFRPTIIITLILLIPFNLLVCFLLSIDLKSTILSVGGISGNIVILIFGCVVAYIRDLTITRQAELKRLEVAETQLTAYRSRLESMVDEKTAELSEKIIQLETQERERIRLTQIIEQATELIMIMDADGTLQYVNPAVSNLMGYSVDDILGQNIFKTAQKTQPNLRKETLTAFETGKVWTRRFTHRKKNGETRVVETTLSPVLGASGELINILSIGRDVTKELEMENRLRQAQKIESIGTLAGGIAHDFNNILGVILGYTELSLQDIEKKSTAHTWLQQVVKAVARAKDLVNQILTFSRAHTVNKLQIQTIPIINEVCQFMRSSLPTTIEIKQDIRTNHDSIMADPTQFQQVLMNLCTNAGQAMLETGGVLDVVLEETNLNEDELPAYQGLRPGPYMKLSVKDTGPGIRKEHLHRIFDPYFTTKEQGKGTGLGLAVVHGIVKENEGDIKVYSTPGQGTVFHVFFPLVEKTAEVSTESPAPPPRGTETVMFVDDEELLVGLGTRMLERLGYKATGFSNPEEALSAFKDSKDSYDLIITDKTMPGLPGLAFAEEIKKIRPDIPILLCTGFADKDIDDKVRKAGIAECVMKPLNNLEMAVAVRRVLDGGKA